MTFVHTFVVSHLKRSTSGILCMDILKQAGMKSDSPVT